MAAEVSYNNAWYTFGGGLAKKEAVSKSYTPFGELLTENVSGFGYNGEYYNAATGLIYLRARFYAPEMNRFSQKDILRGSAFAPQSLNRYLYVQNDPVNFIDPSGQTLKSAWNMVKTSVSNTVSKIISNPKAAVAKLASTAVKAVTNPVGTAVSAVKSAYTAVKTVVNEIRTPAPTPVAPKTAIQTSPPKPSGQLNSTEKGPIQAETLAYSHVNQASLLPLSSSSVCAAQVPSVALMAGGAACSLLLASQVTGLARDPKIWSLKHDSEGVQILWHYLYGNGSDFIKNNGTWGTYMKSDSLLKRKVQDIVLPMGAELDVGETQNINIITSMEIENGEDIIGYQYLHGTNASAGGFTINGSVSKDAAGNVIYNLVYTWNDIIDPNYDYGSDRAKAEFAGKIPFANPTDYKISISWDDVTVINTDDMKQSSGWLVPKS